MATPADLRRRLDRPGRRAGAVPLERRPRGRGVHRPERPVHPRRDLDHDPRVRPVDHARDGPGHRRSPRAAQHEPGDLRDRDALRVARPRHAAAGPDLLRVLRPAPGRHRAPADPDRHHRARLQLRRVHDRDLPCRDPGRSARPERGGAGARHARVAHVPPDRPAAGSPDRDPRDRQRVHRDDQGQLARLDHHGPGAPVAGPERRPCRVPDDPRDPDRGPRYWVLTIIFSLFQDRLERRLSRGER